MNGRRQQRSSSTGAPGSALVLLILAAPGTLHADDQAPFRALVYEHNPVRSPTPTLLPLPLPTRGNALEHTFLTVRSCVERGAKAGEPALSVCSALASAQRKGANFAALPRTGEGADPFAEQMLFFHAARTLVQLEKLGIRPVWSAPKPLQLIANVRLSSAVAGNESAPGALQKWPDARHVSAAQSRGGPEPAPGGDAIWFGEGTGGALALDGDVITHEVTHAVLGPWLREGAWQLDEQGANGEALAVDEALADYVAALVGGDPLVGEYAARSAAAFQARDLSVRTPCPTGLSGRSHADGLVLSSALWAARTSGDAAAFDHALMHAVQTLHDTPATFERLLTPLVAALDRDTPAHAEAVRASFRTRGLWPRCVRILEIAAGQSLAGQAESFYAPGTHELAAARLSPGIVQLRVRVPPHTTHVTLRTRVSKAREHASPYTPVLISKAAAPIRWSAEEHDGIETQATPTGAVLRSFRVPTHGAPTLFLQLANQGEQPGWYDDLAVSFHAEKKDEPVATKRPARRSSIRSWLAVGLALGALLLLGLRALWRARRR